MVLSMLVAKIISLLFIASGIAALTTSIDFDKILTDFKKSAALTFVTGFFAIIVGMILVEFHNIWVMNWTVLITIFGWAAVLKGLMFIMYPNSMSFFRDMFKNKRYWGIFYIAVGLLFGYWGFF